MQPLFRAAAIVAGAVLLGVMTVTPAIPASAHSSLASSSPVVDERLATAPTEVSLVFATGLLSLGAVIIVADANGRDWAAGEPVINGTEVTMALEPGMPDAGYEVRWRVVSEDGHPISDAIPFTVGDGERYSSVPDSLPNPAQSAQGESAAGVSGTTITTTEDGGIGRIVLVGGIGAAIALAVLVGIELIRRRDRRRDPAPTAPDNEGTAS